MKHRKTIVCILILLIVKLSSVNAQVGADVAKDARIAKFEKDIIIYLSKEKQHIDIGNPFNIEDYKYKIFVRKCLEVFSGTTGTNLLLIQFSLSADHADRFWGVLSTNEKYFFYDIDDTGESELLEFKKRFDPIAVSTILFYCYQYPPGVVGAIPMAYGIYQRNLTVVKDALHNKEELGSVKVDSAISFLQGITTIKAGLHKDNSRKYHLTQDDYTRWLNWYNENY